MASPPPTKYDLGTAFGGKSPQSRAFSFGLSREHFKKQYLKENLGIDPIVPGPGQYDLETTKKLHQGLMYSLRPKTTKDSSFQNTTKGFPGPGTYEMSATEDKSGFCFVSKYKSSTGTKFHVLSAGNLTGSDRIDVNMMRRSMQIPGPGNYENHEKLKMDAKGTYQFSKWRSSGAPVFSRGMRNTNLETSVTRKSMYLSYLLTDSSIQLPLDLALIVPCQSSASPNQVSSALPPHPADEHEESKNLIDG